MFSPEIYLFLESLHFQQFGKKLFFAPNSSRNRLFGEPTSVGSLGAETGWRGTPFYVNSAQVLTLSLMTPLSMGSVLATPAPGTIWGKMSLQLENS